MAAPPSVLVLGTGELGGGILRSLARHPARKDSKLAVLKRPASQNTQSVTKQREVAELEALGVEILRGDMVHDSTEYFVEMFSKFHTVINCNGMELPPETQVKVANMAIQSGIQRYFPWQFGGDYDAIGRHSAQSLFDVQLDVRDLLRGQEKMKWVIVSTGMFTSFLFEPAFGMLDAERRAVTAFGSWENRITVTAPEDIGKVTAEIVMTHPEMSGVVYAAGDTVSMQRLADVVDQTLGRKVERRLKTVAQLKEELAAAPDDNMQRYRVVFAEGVGVSWDRASTFNAKRGIPTQTVDEWARQNLVAEAST